MRFRLGVFVLFGLIIGILGSVSFVSGLTAGLGCTDCINSMSANDEVTVRFSGVDFKLNQEIFLDTGVCLGDDGYIGDDGTCSITMTSLNIDNNIDYVIPIRSFSCSSEDDLAYAGWGLSNRAAGLAIPDGITLRYNNIPGAGVGVVEHTSDLIIDLSMWNYGDGFMRWYFFVYAPSPSSSYGGTLSLIPNNPIIVFDATNTSNYYSTEEQCSFPNFPNYFSASDIIPSQSGWWDAVALSSGGTAYLSGSDANEDCSTVGDEDGNGDADCADSACIGQSGPGGEICCESVSDCSEHETCWESQCHYCDQDDDGHYDATGYGCVGGDDCNDYPSAGGASIYLGALEDCDNGKDDNCDGFVDGLDAIVNPGETAGDVMCLIVGCLIDADEDGSCSEDDCNDQNPNIKPGIAGEKAISPNGCKDGDDNDCDGLQDCLDLDDCWDDPLCSACEDKDGDYYTAGAAPAGVECPAICGPDENAPCAGDMDCHDVAEPAPLFLVGIGAATRGVVDDPVGGWGIDDQWWRGRGHALQLKSSGKKDKLPSRGGNVAGEKINPGIVEICNNKIDDNCNGKIDCADEQCLMNPICLGFSPECEDEDGDYYPADDRCILNQQGCGPDENEQCILGQGKDCHDDNVNANPGIIFEEGVGFCADGLDNDCDAEWAEGGTDCFDSDCMADPDCGECENLCSPDLPDFNLCDSIDQVVMKLDSQNGAQAVSWDFEEEYEVCPRGRIGHWRFDEGAGDTAFDSSGSDFDGVLEGSSKTQFDGDPYDIVYVKWHDSDPGADACKYVVPNWDANKDRYEVRECSNDDFCCYCTEGFNSTGRNGYGVTGNYCYPEGTDPGLSGEGPSWVDGHIGEEDNKQAALSFSGTTRVNVGDPAELNPENEMSIEFLIKTSDTDADVGSLFSRRASAEWAQRLTITEGKLHFGYAGEVELSGNSNADIANGEWHHVVAINDGEDLKLYVNGALAGSTSVGGDFLQSQSNSYIGNSISGGSFEGILDEVSFYKRALTAEDVEERKILMLTDMGSCVGEPLSYYRYEICSPNEESIDRTSNPFLWMSSEDGSLVSTTQDSTYDVPIHFGDEMNCEIIDIGAGDSCAGEVIVSLSDKTDAIVYSGDNSEGPIKVCCYDPSLILGDVHWALMNGTGISESNIGSTVKMIFKNTGLPEGTNVTFEIWEDDVVNDPVRTISKGSEINGTVDASGTAVAIVTLTEEDYIAGNEAGEGGSLEFYFVALGNKSNQLTVTGNDPNDKYPFDLKIVNPKCGEDYLVGDNVSIEIEANDSDDSIYGEVSLGDQKIGEVTDTKKKFNYTVSAAGNVQITVDGTNSRGHKRRAITSIIVIEAGSDGIYTAACIDSPADYGDVTNSTVFFDASSSRAVKWKNNILTDLTVSNKDVLDFHWEFSDMDPSTGNHRNNDAYINGADEKAYKFFKEFSGIDQGHWANLEVTYVGPAI
ncbi:LamG domain-containing protein [archaeon]|mgnify:CR=1 FL=1|nr:LamG domain-containing protein [archaeon]MBT7025307.1 LamG domain-containing protein [archaeon]